MRITSLRATPAAVPFRSDEVWAFGRRRGLVSVLLEVETDEGVVGVGEAAAYPSCDIVLAVLSSLRPLVIGANPVEIERLVRRIELVGTWHHVKATSPAIAAVEMACWDIVGKAAGQPLVNLFGGRFHDRVEYFYYVASDTPSSVSAEAARAASLGFRTCYLKVGADDPAVDIDRVAALRDGAGPNMALRVDANEAWSAGAAIRTLSVLERYELELVEQPVSGRSLPEMAYVRSRINTPLLANEASWTRYDQLAVIQAGAADAVSVDNQMDGGLLNMKRSAGMCEAAGLPVVKHSLGELGVAQAAALHVIASTPNFRYANQGYGALLVDDVVTGLGSYVDGTLAVPDGPGLGVRLDPERMGLAAERYEREGAGYGFSDGDVLSRAPALPKR